MDMCQDCGLTEDRDPRLPHRIKKRIWCKQRRRARRLEDLACTLFEQKEKK